MGDRYIYLTTLTSSTKADFHKGRVNKKYTANMKSI
jgi:hypothetical protein